MKPTLNQGFRYFAASKLKHIYPAPNYDSITDSEFQINKHKIQSAIIQYPQLLFDTKKSPSLQDIEQIRSASGVLMNQNIRINFIFNVKNSNFRLEDFLTPRITKPQKIRCTDLNFFGSFTSLTDFQFISLIYSSSIIYKVSDWGKMIRASKTEQLTDHVMKVHDADTACTIFDFSASSTMFPVLTLKCPFTTENRKIFELEINFPTITDCENFWVSNLLFFSTEKHRERRQALIGLAGLAGAALGHEIQSFFMGDTNDKIEDLQLEIKEEIVHQADFDSQIKGLAHQIKLYSESANKLINLEESQLCDLTLNVRKVTIEVLYNNIVDEFISGINFLLISASSKLRGNKFEKIAIKLCISRNKEKIKDNVNEICSKYFENNGHKYSLIEIQTVNVYKNDKNFGKIPGVGFSLKISIPQFSEISTNGYYKINQIPLPLAVSKNKYFHFLKYSYIPKNGIFLKNYDRHITIDACQISDPFVFCDEKNFNDLFSNDDICLNSIFTKDLSCGPKHIISSKTNCISGKDSENSVLLISHVNEIKIISEIEGDSIISLKNTKPNLLGSNISILSNLKGKYQIKCTNSEFTWEPNFNIGRMIFNENFTKANPDVTLLNEIQILSKPLGLEYKNLSDTETHLKAEIRKIESYNPEPRISGINKFDNRTLWYKWIFPIVSVGFVFLLLCSIFIYMKKLIQRCREYCRPKASNISARYNRGGNLVIE